MSAFSFSPVGTVPDAHALPIPISYEEAFMQMDDPNQKRVRSLGAVIVDTCNRVQTNFPLDALAVDEEKHAPPRFESDDALPLPFHMDDIISQLHRKHGEPNSLHNDEYLPLVKRLFMHAGRTQCQIKPYNHFVTWTIRHVLESMKPIEWVHPSGEVTHTVHFERIWVGRPTDKRGGIQHILDNVKPLRWKSGSSREQMALHHEARRRLSKMADTALTPAACRMHQITYCSPIFMDIRETISKPGGEIINERIAKRVHIGDIPTMVGSHVCSLDGLDDELMQALGECTRDTGGYFVVNGIEKLMCMRERGAQNRVVVYTKGDIRSTTNSTGAERTETEEGPTPSIDIRGRANASRNVIGAFTRMQIIAEVRSVADLGFYAASTLSLHLVINKADCNRPFLGVRVRAELPFLRSKRWVPVITLFAALGVQNIEHIITMVIGKIETAADREIMELFRPSIEEAVQFRTMNQAAALDYIISNCSVRMELAGATGSVSHKQLIQIMALQVLPHVGVHANAILEKALFLAHMTRQLLDTVLGRRLSDNRDSMAGKCIESSCALMTQLFAQRMKRVRGTYERNYSRDMDAQAQSFRSSDQSTLDLAKHIHVGSITIPFLYAMVTGSWTTGSMHTTSPGERGRMGVVQALNRITRVSIISHLHRLSVPTDKTGNMAKPRHLNSTHWGVICPAETPGAGLIWCATNITQSAS